MTETISAKPRTARVSSVEFWRLFFTVFVCIYHLEIFFYSQKKVLSGGTAAVEFFFILAGFTMAMSAKRKQEGRLERMTPKEASAQALDYVVKKLKAIYPILTVVLLFGFVLYPLLGVQSASAMFGFGKQPSILQSLLNSEWEWLMMIGTPFGYNNGATQIVPLWFLTPLLVVGYLYTYALNRHYDFTMFAAPAIGILGYIFFTLNSSMMIDFYVKMGFLNAGSVHAIAEMALGISMFRLYDHLSKKDFSKFWQIVITIIELFAIYRILALTINQGVSMDNFRKIPYLLVIVLTSFLNVGYVARTLNRPIWRVLGSITLPMYLCHVQLIQVYLQGLVWVKTLLIRNLYTSMSAGSWLMFLSKTGGFDENFRSVPMSWRDALLFVLLTVAVSLIIMGVVALSKRGIKSIKTWATEREAQRALLNVPPPMPWLDDPADEDDAAADAPSDAGSDETSAE